MLFRETVAVYCENHTEHTNTLCGVECRVFVMLKQVVHIVTTGVQRVKMLRIWLHLFRRSLFSLYCVCVLNKICYFVQGIVKLWQGGTMIQSRVNINLVAVYQKIKPRIHWIFLRLVICNSPPSFLDTLTFYWLHIDVKDIKAWRHV
jgi:hypothetical protein